MELRAERVNQKYVVPISADLLPHELKDRPVIHPFGYHSKAKRRLVDTEEREEGSGWKGASKRWLRYTVSAACLSTFWVLDNRV